MRFCVVLAIVCAAVALAGPFDHLSKEELETKTWAVIAAGSDGWSNYRHQADVCHLYQVLHKLGVPDERIIVFMKDDIANSPSNPRKGVIINEPGGPNVYEGVPKDYTGSAVTTDNFLKVLRGETMTVGSGKTLRSTKDDNVFVFFDDHGAPGALCFPEGCKLTGPRIEETVQYMSDNNRYGKFIFYIEACYAGSVLYKQKLPKNAYFTTASPVGASSFAYNWDATVRAYVADIYSFLFIHHTETVAVGSTTFNDEYNMLCTHIENYSQPCQYGDIAAIGPVTLGKFYQPAVQRGGLDMHYAPPPKPITDAVPAWDVPYETARRLYEADPSPQSLVRFKREAAYRLRVDNMAQRILDKAVTLPHLATPPCTTCTSACKCMQYCGTSAHCKFQCCDERSCHMDKAPTVNGLTADQRHECSLALSQVFLEECGFKHDYLRSVDRSFIRACMDPNINMEAAIEAIRSECRA